MTSTGDDANCNQLNTIHPPKSEGETMLASKQMENTKGASVSVLISECCTVDTTE